MRFRHRHATDAAAIEAIAHEVIRTLPPPFPDVARDVVVQVVEFPDDETMTEMELETPYDLLGLYRGVSLDRKSVTDAPHDVDIVFLYRAAIEDYVRETGERAEDVVRHVVIHEIGHHFGFSDEDMERIEADE